MFFRLLTIMAAMAVGATAVEGAVSSSCPHSQQCGVPVVYTPSVRAMIVQDADKACLEVCGKYAVIDPCSNATLSCNLNGKCREVSALRSGLKWGEEFPDLYHVKIVPLAYNTVIFIDGVPYSGVIAIYDVEGRINIVNEVDIEDYVASMIASNVKEPTAKEALAALAITLRTEAYYRSTFPRNNFWDIDARAAGYRGSSEVPSSKAANEAVKATAYMVMDLPSAKKKAVSASNEEVGLFAAQWALEPAAGDQDKGRFRTIKLIVSEANAAAAQGQNAAHILNKTFPGTSIQRMVIVN